MKVTFKLLPIQDEKYKQDQAARAHAKATGAHVPAIKPRYNNPSNIYVRLSGGRGIQGITTTNIPVNPAYWSFATNKIKPQFDYEAKTGTTNKRLNELAEKIQTRYSAEYATHKIDTIWLRGIVAEWNNRVPDGVAEWQVYFYDFLEHVVGDDHRNKRFKNFEKGNRLKIKDIGALFSEQYAQWMEGQGLSANTINQELAYFKKWLLYAKQTHKIEILEDKWFKYKQKVVKPKILKTVALTQAEVDKIYNHDFSDQPHLQNVQRLLILGFYTGARYSDIGKVSRANITTIHEAGHDIQVLKFVDQKTSDDVLLPVHPRVLKVLDLPHRIIDNALFGEYAKELGKQCGFDRILYGRKYNVIREINGKRVRRTEEGNFPLHELLTSHVMRRTFASLNYTKIPTGLLMKLTGHNTEKDLRNYIGISDNAGAIALHKIWADEN